MGDSLPEPERGHRREEIHRRPADIVAEDHPPRLLEAIQAACTTGFSASMTHAHWNPSTPTSRWGTASGDAEWGTEFMHDDHDDDEAAPSWPPPSPNREHSRSTPVRFDDLPWYLRWRIAWFVIGAFAWTICVIVFVLTR